MKKIVNLIIFLSIIWGTKAQKTPLMGWSSWNAFGIEIGDSLIRSQVDAMITLGFAEKGYRYINIDDGFFGGRDKNGRLLPHPKRFANGLAPLVKYIHALGLKAGIYTDAGANTCASYWANPKDSLGIGVGLYGHDKEDLTMYFDELDFDFIKVDYCGAEARNNIDRLDLDEEERFKQIAKAIKEVKKKDVSWNICRWAFPGTWVTDLASSWRMSEDIYLGWESVKSIISQNLYLSAYASLGHYNDMDMLEVGRGMSEEEDKTHFGMWCIMSSPLLIGCDLNKLNETALLLLQNEELIALNQDTLGLQAYVVEKTNDCYILVKDVEELYGKKRAVSIYNPSDSEKKIRVEFETLDLFGEIKARDLFERKDIGVFEDSMLVSLPAHSCRIYVFEAKERKERKIYEAETAWLSAYQELEDNKSKISAVYKEKQGVSGGAIVENLGEEEENDLQWRAVYSEEGGKYEMNLSYLCNQDRNLNISVNGKTIEQITLNASGEQKTKKQSFEIELGKGNNVIRLYSNKGKMPDIDCMELRKIR
jgi:hypothetical protein